MGALLQGKGVTKFFGGLPALSRVDFAIHPGEIVGLIGPNGAGKTTLINVITGLLRPSAGEISFKGERIDHLPPYRISRKGIVRTFQVIKPFSRMTVRENVLVGALFGRGGRGFQEAERVAGSVLSLVGLQGKEAVQASVLPLADRKRLELAKALAMVPELLILDEVMAGLNPREVGEFMALIRRINREGVTVLVVEHVMKAIMGISHRVLVLHHGEKVAEGAPEEVVRDPRVIQAYLGARYAGRQDAEGP